MTILPRPRKRGGWIDRRRDPSDRRGVVVQAARGRAAGFPVGGERNGPRRRIAP